MTTTKNKFMVLGEKREDMDIKIKKMQLRTFEWLGVKIDKKLHISHKLTKLCKKEVT